MVSEQCNDEGSSSSGGNSSSNSMFSAHSKGTVEKGYHEADAASGAVTHSVLQRILKSNAEVDDSTPLTTQAVRDLQKAQKERIYARTLVRVK